MGCCTGGGGAAAAGVVGACCCCGMGNTIAASGLERLLMALDDDTFCSRLIFCFLLGLEGEPMLEKKGSTMAALSSN